MRRVLVTALVALTAVAAVGCAGEDAREAQRLLAQSEQAMNEVSSFRFSMRMWTSGAPDDVTMTMRGGGYAKGKRAGDFFMTAAVDGGSTLSDFSLVSPSGATYINVGAGWQRTSLPGAAPAAKMGNPFAGFD